MNNQSQITVLQIFGALARHRGKALLVWLLVMILVTVAFLFLPRKYGSEGKVYVRMGRNNSSITPATTSGSISIQDSRETEIRSVVEILRSSEVIGRVVDQVGAEKILENPLDKWMPNFSLPIGGAMESTSTEPEALSPAEYASLRDREKAVKTLKSSMDVFSEKSTSVINIYVKAYSPQLAQELVEGVIEHARQVHLQVHASEGSAIFFDDQYEVQEKKLNAAIGKLAEFRNERKILSLGAERDSQQGILTSLENDIIQAEIETERANEGLTKLQGLAAKTQAMIAIPTAGVERKSYEDASARVFDLQTQRAGLVARFFPNHPEVIAIDQQLSDARISLDKLTSDRTESAMMSNPVYEEIQVDLIRAETDYAASLARLKSLRCKKDESVAKFADLNNAEIVADQLQRDVDVARQYLSNYTQKRGEAMAMSMLDESEISDVIVAQQATLGLKHISPRGSLFLPFGFIVGCLAALATTLFFERNNLSATLKEGDVEQILGLPVLVTLPRVYSSRNMVN